jgi:two-component system sensor histidine kinase KdpD
MVGIAKVEAGAIDVRNTTTSVEEIVGNAIDRARIRLEDHVLETALAPDLPALVLDAASVSQVVFTLLDNAAKYSPAGSRIRLSAHLTSDSKLRIVVEDQGEGIPSVDRERVFDKFFRLGESDVHTTASGLGLGLAIARGIIESQGGRIWIEDGSRDFVTRVVCELPTESAVLERKAVSK